MRQVTPLAQDGFRQVRLQTALRHLICPLDPTV
jgi:hypothetical protein